MKEKRRRGMNKIAEKGRKGDAKKTKRIGRIVKETTRRTFEEIKRRGEKESWREEINLFN